MGGYTGDRTFIIAIDQDRVVRADIDNVANGLIAEQCLTGLRNGLLPPVPNEVAAVQPPSPTGLSLKVMPDGAYVSAVAPGSLAATAGLRPGMVIETVNGIGLKDMGEAMVKVIDAAGRKASLGLVGGTLINMGE